MPGADGSGRLLFDSLLVWGVLSRLFTGAEVSPHRLRGAPGHHGGEGLHIRLPDGLDGTEVLPQVLPAFGPTPGIPSRADRVALLLWLSWW